MAEGKEVGGLVWSPVIKLACSDLQHTGTGGHQVEDEVGLESSSSLPYLVSYGELQVVALHHLSWLKVPSGVNGFFQFSKSSKHLLL